MAIVLKSAAAKEQVRDLVLDNWKTMYEERATRLETWKRCLMAYLCVFDKNWVKFAKQANRSHRFVALSFDAVETITPQIVDAIFGIDDWLNVRPLQSGYDESDDVWAEAQKALLKYQMMFGKFESTVRLGAKQLVMLGNCPRSISWRKFKTPDYERTGEAMERWLEQAAEYHQEFEQVKLQYEKVALQAKILGQPAPPEPEFAPPPSPPKDMDTVFKGPVLSLGSIFNYVQEQHPDDDFSSIRILRSWKTKSYLKKIGRPDKIGYRLYENVNQVVETTSEEQSTDNEAEQLFKMAIGLQMPTGKSKPEVKEQHGTFELSGVEGGTYENYICTVAGNTLIRCEPAPMYSGRPQVGNARLIKMHGDPYGIGVIEKALDEQDSASAIHNQSIDAVNAVIQPEYEVVESRLADIKMKPSGPGVKHYVDEPGTITPIAKNFQGIPMGFAALEAAIQRHERITGAVNTGGGSKESATRTARNTNIIATKLGAHVVALEEELINPALNIMMEMNAQYLDDDQIVAIIQNGEFQNITISPESIRRGWFVYSAGSKYLADKEARTQELLMAVQMSEQAKASGMPSPVNEWQLWRMLMKEIMGDSEGVVKGEQQYKQEVEQYQQQQIQLQMEAARNDGQGNQAQAGAGAGENTVGAQPGVA